MIERHTKTLEKYHSSKRRGNPAEDVFCIAAAEEGGFVPDPRNRAHLFLVTLRIIDDKR